MRAIEFKSKIRDNAILIPHRIKSRLLTEDNKNVRVMVFLDDTDVYDNKAFRQVAKAQFLKGYADSDAIYDN